jgi:hypothetical protein
MTVVDYIKKKNEILHKHTDVILVPEDQIEECEQYPLSMVADSRACPYCKVYFGDSYLTRCDKCPMNVVGNNCKNETSTYSQIVPLRSTSITGTKTPWYKELKKLIDQYNKELKEQKS